MENRMPTIRGAESYHVGLQKIVCDSPCPTLTDKEEQKKRDSGYSSASFSEGYHSISCGVEEYIFGETRNRGRQQKHNTDCQATRKLTEEEAWKIAPDIGSHYRDVARELKITEAEIDEIDDDKNGRNPNKEKALAVLHKFMQKQGSGATIGRLAFALDKAGRRDIAEKLIGDADFLLKKKDQATFILKEQAHIHCDTPDDNTKVWICEDKDGCLYRLEKLKGLELEKYKKFKASQQERRGSTVVDTDRTHCSDLADDHCSIFESKRMQKRIVSLQEELKMHEELLKEMQRDLEKQEGQEDKRSVALQLDETENQLSKLHNLASSLVRQADHTVRYLKEPFIPKCQIYDVSISLSAIGNKLEERIKSFKSLEMTIRDEILQLRLSKLSESCLSLRNLMQEKIYLGSLRDLTPQAKERRHLLSSSTSIPREKVDESLETRLNTMPKSDREMKELEERTRPPKDPMEECDVWTTKL